MTRTKPSRSTSLCLSLSTVIALALLGAPVSATTSAVTGATADSSTPTQRRRSVVSKRSKRQPSTTRARRAKAKRAKAKRTRAKPDAAARTTRKRARAKTSAQSARRRKPATGSPSSIPSPGTSPGNTAPAPSVTPGESAAVVATAMTLEGRPYAYASKGPSSFDCSGFTHYVLKQHGVEVTGGSRHQAQQGEAVSLSQVRAGDLVFFRREGEIRHVALVVDKTADTLVIIHATNRGVVVDDVRASSYWNPQLAFARRVL